MQANRSAQDFRRAMTDKNWTEAAALIRDLQERTFRAEASALLLKPIRNKLAGVGINFQQQEIIKTDGEASKRQALVAHEVYTLLTTTGEPDHKEMAARILALVGPERLIRTQLEKLGFGGSDLLDQMVAALLTLCHADHSLELDLILKTAKGQRLAAQAVIDHLSVGNGATVTLLFTVFAHRIDLRAALSPPSTLETPRAPQWHRLKERMKSVKFDETQWADCTRHLHQWMPGWRLLLSMNLAPYFFDRPDPALRPAVIAIDAAAAGAKSGAAFEVERLAEDGWSYDALAAMLNVRELDLFPNDALGNVMAPLVSDMNRAERTFDWVKEPQRPQEQRVRLYTAIARALVRVLPAGSPDGFDQQLPVNAAAGYAASLLVGQPDVAEAVQSRIDSEEWKQLWILAAMNAQI